MGYYLLIIFVKMSDTISPNINPITAEINKSIIFLFGLPLSI